MRAGSASLEALVAQRASTPARHGLPTRCIQTTTNDAWSNSTRGECSANRHFSDQTTQPHISSSERTNTHRAHNALQRSRRQQSRRAEHDSTCCPRSTQKEKVLCARPSCPPPRRVRVHALRRLRAPRAPAQLERSSPAHNYVVRVQRMSRSRQPRRRSAGKLLGDHRAPARRSKILRTAKSSIMGSASSGADARIPTLTKTCCCFSLPASRRATRTERSSSEPQRDRPSGACES